MPSWQYQEEWLDPGWWKPGLHLLQPRHVALPQNQCFGQGEVPKSSVVTFLFSWMRGLRKDFPHEMGSFAGGACKSCGIKLSGSPTARQLMEGTG